CAIWGIYVSWFAYW
nr:immunoglobulin heavy chain junction region [Mus musculus]MBK4187526.1 immunoglobulin heavy chain junction region [Mus musculus]MBK4187528.1 immunoglobulin heavy chain junction region [Mus musculus]